MKQQANATTKTQKEILVQKSENAETEYRQAADVVNGFGSHVKTEREALKQLENKYAAATRTVAGGGAADLNEILGEKERRTHRLHGLEQLLAEATERLRPLHAAQQAAARALQTELDREELERLTNAIVDAEQVERQAHAAVRAAEQALSKAKGAREHFRRQIELAERREQLAAQGRA